MAQQTNAVAKTNEGDFSSLTLTDLFSTPEIRKTISDTLGVARVQTFIGSALTVAQDPKIKDIEPTSVFNCLLKSATYNFPIDPALGYAYIVPYKNKDKVKIAQFQMGTKGLVELALRTGQYKRLNVKEVREGEHAGLDFFGEPEIKWLKNREKLPVVGYMAAYELINGMTKIVYWDINELKEHANRYSKAHQNAIKEKNFQDDLWTNDFDSMASKTVLKDLLKYAPKSIELQNALIFDQAVIERKNGVERAIYVDNDNGTEIIDAEKEYDIPNEPEQTTKDVISEEEKEAGIRIISYKEYIHNTDKYEKQDYPNGDNAFQVIDGKKTMRVKIISNEGTQNA